MRIVSPLAAYSPILSLVAACGGAAQVAPPTAPASATAAKPTPRHDCKTTGEVTTHDLHGEGKTEALVPCAKDGGHDHSGVVRIESIPEGVHVMIDATDDDVDTGVLGSDVKTRDAVLVYPRGPGSKAVEIPLAKTEHGYRGDRIILWEELDKLTDEGTKLHIAVYDHDAKSGQASEEMHVTVAVSTGKSCERAQDENPQTVAIGGKSAPRNLTPEQLGAPMKTDAFMRGCGLPASSNADLCVAVKKGRALGVSVTVTPSDKRVAACIDRAARRLSFPVNDALDVVKQHF